MQHSIPRPPESRNSSDDRFWPCYVEVVQAFHRHPSAGSGAHVIATYRDWSRAFASDNPDQDRLERELKIRVGSFLAGHQSRTEVAA